MNRSKRMDLAHAAVESATKSGAEDARAFVTRSRNASLEWRDGKLDRIRETTTQRLSLTLFVDGRYSSHATSDIRLDAVKPLVSELVDMTRYLAKDQHRVLPPTDRYRAMHSGDLRLFDSNVTKVIPDSRIATAKEMEASARGLDKDGLIVSVTSSVSDVDTERVCVTSNGQVIGEVGTRMGRSLRVTIHDANDRKPGGSSMSYSRHAHELLSPSVLGKDAYRRALEKRGAKQAPTGVYDVVIENRVVPRFSGSLLQPLSGGALQQKQSFFDGKLNQPVASELLSIRSDPHVAGGWASTTFDREGMATKPLVLFEKGVLKNYFLDTYYSSKLGMETTTGSPTNLIWETGKRSCDEMIKSIDKGLFVTGFLGGNSNRATGDFSTGIKGFFVRRGKIIHPVSEMNISGNHLEVWKNLMEMGNDPWMNSSNQAPSLRFKQISGSGTK